ncbi:hypothetical protein [Planctomycetes bacterium K23_9]|uniref:Uncharacterized protein n=1 Tax=Stieleria marina TaxID=1930275 RepID=A0A517P2R6_9BACT|nr:hypothetical protein K239x_56920 [Planctomycetes bacterium K23_9]
MFKKVVLTGALMAAGLFAFGTTEANAGGCGYGGGYGGYSYGPHVSVGHSPYRSAYRGVPVHRGHYGVPVHRSYRPSPVYRSGYRSGFGVSPYGYGRGIPYGYGRSGITIGFGF